VLVAVQDVRQPGALFACRVVGASWDKAIEACTRVIEGALEDDVPEAGPVRHAG
jgi:hypothetical protein